MKRERSKKKLAANVDDDIPFGPNEEMPAGCGQSEISKSDGSYLGLATPLPPRPNAGVWRDPKRGHGKGRNPVLIVSPRPDPVLDKLGRPVWTNDKTTRERRPREHEHLPNHGAGFINLHETVAEVCKLFIGAGVGEAARLLICDVQQLTYVGREQRATATGAVKDADGTWRLTFDAWREIDDEHIVIDVPPRSVDVDDPSATQAAHRSLPDRETLVDALVRYSEFAGTQLDVDAVHTLFDRAQEMTVEAHDRARQLLIKCGLERYNDSGRLEINAPLLIQGPAGLRKLVIETLRHQEAVLASTGNDQVLEFDEDISKQSEPLGTRSGKRRNLSKSERQRQDIERERARAEDAERKASALMELIDEMQGRARAIFTDASTSDTEKVSAMQHMLAATDADAQAAQGEKSGKRAKQ